MSSLNLKTILDNLPEKTIATVHKDPDVDAIGSLLAFYLIAKSFNKDIYLYSSDFNIQNFNYLPGADQINTTLSDESFDTSIFIDCSDKSRIHSLKTFPECPEIINIDHHQDNTLFGTINMVKDISSVGELLYSECNRLKISLTMDIATNLYAAIAFDTGSFKFSNTTADTFRAASALMETGINISLINNHIFEEKPIEYFEDIKSGLNHTYSDDLFPFLIVHIPYRNNLSNESTINFFRQFEKKELIILCKEKKKNEFKLSFRSKQHINTTNIAKHFSGGGHIHASGGQFFGKYEQLLSELIFHSKKEFS